MVRVLVCAKAALSISMALVNGYSGRRNGCWTMMGNRSSPWTTNRILTRTSPDALCGRSC